MKTAILITSLIVFGVSVGAKVIVNKIYGALKAALEESSLTELEQMSVLDKFATNL